MNETRGSDRRNFCVTCIYSLWGLIGLALGLPAAVYLLVPPRPRKESEWVEAGDVSQLEPGVPNELVFRRNRWLAGRSRKTSVWMVKSLTPTSLPSHSLTSAAPITGTAEEQLPVHATVRPSALTDGSSAARPRAPLTGFGSGSRTADFCSALRNGPRNRHNMGLKQKVLADRTPDRPRDRRPKLLL
jgi:hypothetical protein